MKNQKICLFAYAKSKGTDQLCYHGMHMEGPCDMLIARCEMIFEKMPNVRLR